MITPFQMRMARAALGLSQGAVAKEIGMTTTKVMRLENEVTDGTSGDLKTTKLFFENRGLEFTDSDGVRRRKETLTYRGRDGFRRFMDDVYNVASAEGGEICLYNARPSNWIKWLGEDWYAQHTLRMQEALKEQDFYFKVTAKRGDRDFIGGKHSEYRWVPDEMFNQQSFYVYGDRLAILKFSDEAVEIFVLRKRELADSFRHLFNVAWDSVTTLPDTDDYKPESYKDRT